MENQKKKYTQENITSILDAICEKDIGVLELLQEIVPLLTEYFIGGFKIKDNAIRLNFLNGQKFKLTVEEIVRSMTNN